VLMQAQIEDFHNRVEWGVMKPLLGLIMDPVLVSYICARHDVKLEYKDMNYEHHVGLIVRSPNPARVRELLDDYATRVARDYHASAPPQDRPGH